MLEKDFRKTEELEYSTLGGSGEERWRYCLVF